MNKNNCKKEILVVGAGISGCVIAERYANIGKKVLVLEKRNHIGGNCYDFVNKKSIRISKYGAHLFHTNDKEVWDYVQQFSKWYPYEHKVFSKVVNKLVPVPVNITTINELFNLKINTQQEAIDWFKNETKHFVFPKNSEESSLSRVGLRLYELMFKHYTKKQWDLWPIELEASVMDRIPVRTNYDNRYFTDKYQYLPENGYTSLFENMLNNPNITVELGVDYLESKYVDHSFEKLYFTGPIDKYFSNKFKKLQYRSIDFQFENFKKDFYQKNSVINYPNTNNFTRIVEYKYFAKNPNKIGPHTTISKEYSKWGGEPYYPVPTKKNRIIYDKYRKEAKKIEKENIFFVGRLANYKYFNMDEAFKNALNIFKKGNH
ncbi:MAG: UDP-galactopyranose mutase [Patescibacteria group bacterium]